MKPSKWMRKSVYEAETLTTSELDMRTEEKERDQLSV